MLTFLYRIIKIEYFYYREVIIIIYIIKAK